MENTSVTVVLVGADTANRPWVQYEIIESHNRGNGLLGIYIHGIKDVKGQIDFKGKNPFERIYCEDNGKKTFFSEIYKTYNWVFDNGYNNFDKWIEQAAIK